MTFKPSKQARFLFKAGVISLLCACLIINEAAFAAPVFSHPDPLTSVTVPPALGKIEETYASPGTGPLGPVPKRIIYIQDAHDSLEAQENIAKLVRRFVVKNRVRTVYEEGYEGPVPTDSYFGFMTDPKLREKVSYFLTDKLRLGGAEYAHINRPRDFKLIGADSLKLHLKNIAAYRRQARYQKRIQKDLAALQLEVQRLADFYFPREFKEWMRLKEHYEAGTLPLVEYLQRSSVIAKTEPSSVIARSTEGATKQSPYLLNKTATASLPAFAGNGNTAAFFEKIARLENQIAGKFLRNERDKTLFEYSRTLDLLKRLSRIEVTPAEYEAVKSSLRNFNTQAFADFISKTSRKPILLSKRWEYPIRNAIRFYEIAQARNEAVARHLEEFLKSPSEDTAVLVFGGFHAGDFKRFFKERGISYLVVSPRITRDDPIHQAYYKQLLSVGYHAFETPFQAARALSTPHGYSWPGARAEVRAIYKAVYDLHSQPADWMRQVEQRVQLFRSEARTDSSESTPVDLGAIVLVVPAREGKRIKVWTLADLKMQRVQMIFPYDESQPNHYEYPVVITVDLKNRSVFMNDAAAVPEQGIPVFRDSLFEYGDKRKEGFVITMGGIVQALSAWSAKLEKNPVKNLLQEAARTIRRLPKTMTNKSARSEARAGRGKGINGDRGGVLRNIFPPQSRWRFLGTKSEERVERNTFFYASFFNKGQSEKRMPTNRNTSITKKKSILNHIFGIFPITPPIIAEIARAWKRVKEVFEIASSLFEVQNILTVFSAFMRRIISQAVSAVKYKYHIIYDKKTITSRVFVRSEARGKKSDVPSGYKRITRKAFDQLKVGDEIWGFLQDELYVAEIVAITTHRERTLQLERRKASRLLRGSLTKDDALENELYFKPRSEARTPAGRALLNNQYFPQVHFVGEGRKYLTALVAPNIQELEAFAREHHIYFVRDVDLLHRPEIQNLIWGLVEEANRSLASDKQIRKVGILRSPFIAESNHKEMIEQLYQESSSEKIIVETLPASAKQMKMEEARREASFRAVGPRYFESDEFARHISTWLYPQGEPTDRTFGLLRQNFKLSRMIHYAELLDLKGTGEAIYENMEKLFRTDPAVKTYAVLFKGEIAGRIVFHEGTRTLMDAIIFARHRGNYLGDAVLEFLKEKYGSFTVILPTNVPIYSFLLKRGLQVLHTEAIGPFELNIMGYEAAGRPRPAVKKLFSSIFSNYANALLEDLSSSAPPPEENDLYRNFPDVYDLLYQRFFQRRDDFLDLVKNNTPSGGAILDAAAGTGEVSLPLLQAGYRVRSADLHPGMLAQLKKKAEGRGVEPDTLTAGFLDLDKQGGTYDALTVRQAINYLIGEDNLRQGFKVFHRRLKPGGKLIFNAPHYEPSQFSPPAKGPYRVKFGTRNAIVRETNSMEGRVLTHHQEALVWDGKDPRNVRYYHDQNSFEMYTRDQFTRALKEAGFSEIKYDLKGTALYVIATAGSHENESLFSPKMIVVGGNFDAQGGSPSSLIAQIHAALPKGTVLRNGGNVNELKNILDELAAYDVILWFPSVPNEEPKYRNVKERYPLKIVVTSKRNHQGQYSDLDIVEHALQLKSNLIVEFSDSLPFNMRLMDTLGNTYENTRSPETLAKAVMERLRIITTVTRQGARAVKGGARLRIPASPEFFRIIRKQAGIFQKLMGSRKTIPESAGERCFRCERGFPSMRLGDFVYVSKRAFEEAERYPARDDMVPIDFNQFRQTGQIFYYGPHKPAVDTPIQMKLYQYFPHVRYIVHSHEYVAGAPFTKVVYASEALQEADQILDAVGRDSEKSNFAVNLLGHGSVVLAADLGYLESVSFVARPFIQEKTKINALLIGGMFDEKGGRPSDFAAKLHAGFPKGVDFKNGGSLEDLNSILENLARYEVVLWFAQIPEDKKEILRSLKQRYPFKKLIPAFKNDPQQYSFQELVNEALGIRSNLFIEIAGARMRLYDPLSNQFADTEKPDELIQAILERLEALQQFTRQGTVSIGPSIPVPANEEFERYLAQIKHYGTQWHDLIHPAEGVERFLGNTSFRAAHLFPEAAFKNIIYMSQRNVDKRNLDSNGFVAVDGSSYEKFKMEFYGDRKPSVDTPTQVRFYALLPNVNYILHAHVYMQGAPFTSRLIPCGSLEEVEEVMKLIGRDTAKTNFAVNLLGHGSIIFARDLSYLEQGLPYVPRPMPEKLSTDGTRPRSEARPAGRPSPIYRVDPKIAYPASLEAIESAPTRDKITKFINYLVREFLGSRDSYRRRFDAILKYGPYIPEQISDLIDTTYRVMKNESVSATERLQAVHFLLILNVHESHLKKVFSKYPELFDRNLGRDQKAENRDFIEHNLDPGYFWYDSMVSDSFRESAPEIENIVKYGESKVVLHALSGIGRDAFLMAKRWPSVKIFSLDANAFNMREALDYLQEAEGKGHSYPNLRLLQADARASRQGIPLPDNSVDKVIFVGLAAASMLPGEVSEIMQEILRVTRADQGAVFFDSDSKNVPQEIEQAIQTRQDLEVSRTYFGHVAKMLYPIYLLTLHQSSRSEARADSAFDKEKIRAFLHRFPPDVREELAGELQLLLERHRAHPQTISWVLEPSLREKALLLQLFLFAQSADGNFWATVSEASELPSSERQSYLEKEIEELRTRSEEKEAQSEDRVVKLIDGTAILYTLDSEVDEPAVQSDIEAFADDAVAVLASLGIKPKKIIFHDRTMRLEGLFPGSGEEYWHIFNMTVLDQEGNERYFWWEAQYKYLKKDSPVRPLLLEMIRERFERLHLDFFLLFLLGSPHYDFMKEKNFAFFLKQAIAKKKRYDAIYGTQSAATFITRELERKFGQPTRYKIGLALGKASTPSSVSYFDLVQERFGDFEPYSRSEARNSARSQKKDGQALFATLQNIAPGIEDQQVRKALSLAKEIYAGVPGRDKLEHAITVTIIALKEYFPQSGLTKAQDILDLASAGLLHDALEDASEGTWGRQQLNRRVRKAALWLQIREVQRRAAQKIAEATNPNVLAYVRAVTRPGVPGVTARSEENPIFDHQLIQAPLISQLVKIADRTDNYRRFSAGWPRERLLEELSRSEHLLSESSVLPEPAKRKFRDFLATIVAQKNPSRSEARAGEWKSSIPQRIGLNIFMASVFLIFAWFVYRPYVQPWIEQSELHLIPGFLVLTLPQAAIAGWLGLQSRQAWLRQLLWVSTFGVPIMGFLIFSWAINLIPVGPLSPEITRALIHQIILAPLLYDPMNYLIGKMAIERQSYQQATARLPSNLLNFTVLAFFIWFPATYLALLFTDLSWRFVITQLAGFVWNIAYVVMLRLETLGFLRGTGLARGKTFEEKPQPWNPFYWLFRLYQQPFFGFYVLSMTYGFYVAMIARLVYLFQPGWTGWIAALAVPPWIFALYNRFRSAAPLVSRSEAREILRHDAFQDLFGMDRMNVDRGIYPLQRNSSSRHQQIFTDHSVSFAKNLANELNQRYTEAAPQDSSRILGIGPGSGIDSLTAIYQLLRVHQFQRIEMDLVELDASAIQNLRDNLAILLRQLLGSNFEIQEKDAEILFDLKQRGFIRIQRVEEGKEFEGLREDTLYDLIFFNAPSVTFPAVIELSVSDEGRVGLISAASFFGIMGEIKRRLSQRGVALIDNNPDIFEDLQGYFKDGFRIEQIPHERYGLEGRVTYKITPARAEAREAKGINDDRGGVLRSIFQWRSTGRFLRRESARKRGRITFYLSSFFSNGQSEKKTPSKNRISITDIKIAFNQRFGNFPIAPPIVTAMTNPWNKVKQVFETASSLFEVQNILTVFSAFIRKIISQAVSAVKYNYHIFYDKKTIIVPAFARAEARASDFEPKGDAERRLDELGAKAERLFQKAGNLSDLTQGEIFGFLKGVELLQNDLEELRPKNSRQDAGFWRRRAQLSKRLDAFNDRMHNELRKDSFSYKWFPRIMGIIFGLAACLLFPRQSALGLIIISLTGFTTGLVAAAVIRNVQVSIRISHSDLPRFLVKKRKPKVIRSKMKKLKTNKEMPEDLGVIQQRLNQILAQINQVLGSRQSNPPVLTIDEHLNFLEQQLGPPRRSSLMDEMNPLLADPYYRRLDLIARALLDKKGELRAISLGVIDWLDREILPALRRARHPWGVTLPHAYDWLAYTTTYRTDKMAVDERRLKSFLAYVDEVPGNPRAEEALFARFGWYGPRLRNGGMIDRSDHLLRRELLQRMIPILERRLESYAASAPPFAAAFLNGFGFLLPPPAVPAGLTQEKFRVLLRRAIKAVEEHFEGPFFMQSYLYAAMPDNLDVLVLYNKNTAKPISGWEAVNGDPRAETFPPKFLTRRPSLEEIWKSVRAWAFDENPPFRSEARLPKDEAEKIQWIHAVLVLAEYNRITVEIAATLVRAVQTGQILFAEPAGWIGQERNLMDYLVKTANRKLDFERSKASSRMGAKLMTSLWDKYQFAFLMDSLLARAKFREPAAHLVEETLAQMEIPAEQKSFLEEALLRTKRQREKTSIRTLLFGGSQKNDSRGLYQEFEKVLLSDPKKKEEWHGLLEAAGLKQEAWEKDFFPWLRRRGNLSPPQIQALGKLMLYDAERLPEWAPSGRTLSLRQKRQMLELYFWGTPLPEIAKTFALDPGQVRRWFLGSGRFHEFTEALEKLQKILHFKQLQKILSANPLSKEQKEWLLRADVSPEHRAAFIQEYKERKSPTQRFLELALYLEENAEAQTIFDKALHGSVSHSALKSRELAGFFAEELAKASKDPLLRKQFFRALLRAGAILKKSVPQEDVAALLRGILQDPLIPIFADLARRNPRRRYIQEVYHQVFESLYHPVKIIPDSRAASRAKGTPFPYIYENQKFDLNLAEEKWQEHKRRLEQQRRLVKEFLGTQDEEGLYPMQAIKSFLSARYFFMIKSPANPHAIEMDSLVDTARQAVIDAAYAYNAPAYLKSILQGIDGEEERSIQIEHINRDLQELDQEPAVQEEVRKKWLEERRAFLQQILEAHQKYGAGEFSRTQELFAQAQERKKGLEIKHLRAMFYVYFRYRLNALWKRHQAAQAVFERQMLSFDKPRSETADQKGESKDLKNLLEAPKEEALSLERSFFEALGADRAAIRSAVDSLFDNERDRTLMRLHWNLEPLYEDEDLSLQDIAYILAFRGLVGPQGEILVSVENLRQMLNVRARIVKAHLLAAVQQKIHDQWDEFIDELSTDGGDPKLWEPDPLLVLMPGPDKEIKVGNFLRLPKIKSEAGKILSLGLADYQRLAMPPEDSKQKAISYQLRLALREGRKPVAAYQVRIRISPLLGRVKQENVSILDIQDLPSRSEARAEREITKFLEGLSGTNLPEEKRAAHFEKLNYFRLLLEKSETFKLSFLQILAQERRSKELQRGDYKDLARNFTGVQRVIEWAGTSPANEEKVIRKLVQKMKNAPPTVHFILQFMAYHIIRRNHGRNSQKNQNYDALIRAALDSLRVEQPWFHEVFSAEFIDSLSGEEWPAWIRKMDQNLQKTVQNWQVPLEGRVRLLLKTIADISVGHAARIQEIIFEVLKKLKLPPSYAVAESLLGVWMEISAGLPPLPAEAFPLLFEFMSKTRWLSGYDSIVSIFDKELRLQASSRGRRYFEETMERFIFDGPSRPSRKIRKAAGLYYQDARQMLSEKMPTLQKILEDPAKTARFLTVLALLRKLYPETEMTSADISSLAFAEKRRRYVRLREIYIAPYSESFRRHILYVKKGKDIFAIELKIPGENPNRDAVWSEHFTIARKMWNRYGEKSRVAKPLFFIPFKGGPFSLYGKSYSFSEEPLGIAGFVYHDGKRISNLFGYWGPEGEFVRRRPRWSDEYLRRIASQNKMTADQMIDRLVIDIVVAIVRLYAMGFVGESEAGNDVHPENVRLVERGGYGEFVSDFGAFEKRKKGIDRTVVAVKNMLEFVDKPAEVVARLFPQISARIYGDVQDSKELRRLQREMQSIIRWLASEILPFYLPGATRAAKMAPRSEVRNSKILSASLQKIADVALSALTSSALIGFSGYVTPMLMPNGIRSEMRITGKTWTEWIENTTNRIWLEFATRDRWLTPSDRNMIRAETAYLSVLNKIIRRLNFWGSSKTRRIWFEDFMGVDEVEYHGGGTVSWGRDYFGVLQQVQKHFSQYPRLHMIIRLWDKQASFSGYFKTARNAVPELLSQMVYVDFWMVTLANKLYSEESGAHFISREYLEDYYQRSRRKKDFTDYLNESVRISKSHESMNALVQSLGPSQRDVYQKRYAQFQLWVAAKILKPYFSARKELQEALGQQGMAILMNYVDQSINQAAEKPEFDAGQQFHFMIQMDAMKDNLAHMQENVGQYLRSIEERIRSSGRSEMRSKRDLIEMLRSDDLLTVMEAGNEIMEYGEKMLPVLLREFDNAAAGEIAFRKNLIEAISHLFLANPIVSEGAVQKAFRLFVNEIEPAAASKQQENAPVVAEALRAIDLVKDRIERRVIISLMPIVIGWLNNPNSNIRRYASRIVESLATETPLEVTQPAVAPLLQIFLSTPDDVKTISEERALRAIGRPVLPELKKAKVRGGPKGLVAKISNLEKEIQERIYPGDVIEGKTFRSLESLEIGIRNLTDAYAGDIQFIELENASGEKFRLPLFYHLHRDEGQIFFNYLTHLGALSSRSEFVLTLKSNRWPYEAVVRIEEKAGRKRRDLSKRLIGKSEKTVASESDLGAVIRKTIRGSSSNIIHLYGGDIHYVIPQGTLMGSFSPALFELETGVEINPQAIELHEMIREGVEDSRRLRTDSQFIASAIQRLGFRTPFLFRRFKLKDQHVLFLYPQAGMYNFPRSEARWGNPQPTLASTRNPSSTRVRRSSTAVSRSLTSTMSSRSETTTSPTERNSLRRSSTKVATSRAVNLSSTKNTPSQEGDTLLQNPRGVNIKNNKNKYNIYRNLERFPLENKRIFIDFADVAANFSEEQIKEIAYLAERAGRGAQILIYNLDPTDPLGKFFAALKIEGLKAGRLSLRQMAAQYARGFKGEMVHLSSQKVETNAAALKQDLKNILEENSLYFFSYRNGESGTLGAALRDLSRGEVRWDIQAARLRKPFYFEIDRHGRMFVANPEAAGLGFWQKLYDSNLVFAFARAA